MIQTEEWHLSVRLHYENQNVHSLAPSVDLKLKKKHLQNTSNQLGSIQAVEHHYQS